MKELVSIIIPAYNVERYIKQCIQSVLSQTYTNLEIIIVDDGSSDKTGFLCDYYREKDRRISVFHQINQGLSVARNTGFKQSKGSWICFLDSDDWIKETYIETLVGMADRYNADISCCRSQDVDEVGNPIRIYMDTNKEEEYTDEDIIHSLYGKGFNIRFEVWNKIWRRKIIDDVPFIKGQVSEDVYFDRRTLSKANKVVYTDTTLHNYRVQRPGNTNSSFKIARMCVFDEYDKWISDAQEKQWNRSASELSYIACNTAAGLYYAAKRTNQSGIICKRLHTEFKKYYSFLKYTEYNTAKMRLFNFSPTLYSIASLLYKAAKKGDS